MSEIVIKPSEDRRFFGRRLSKTLSPRKTELYSQAEQDILFQIDHEKDYDHSIHPSDLFPHFDAENYILEIGFGGGEHLIHRAKQNPKTAFIGCDAFITGAVRVIDQIREENIQNIRLVNSDALFLIRALSEHSLDGLYLLYPDPWPKKKHRKRRFVQQDTVQEFRRILKKDAFWRFASDITDYIDWVFTAVHETGSFTLNHDHHYKTAFEGWISTRYEQKAFREGRSAHYFEFFPNDPK